MNTFLATGYTGAAIVFLAAFAYARRISQDPANHDPFLTASFIVLNLIGWGVGQRLWAKRRDSPAAIALLVLGDALFPLNLYAPILLYVLGGRVYQSAAVVLLLGIGYHLRNYRHMESARFHPIFYPYFFAASGAALLHVSRPILGLSAMGALWLTLAWAVVLFAVARRWSLEPQLHFPLAITAMLLGTTVLAVWEFYWRPAVPVLGLLFVAGGILGAMARMAGEAGPWGRLVGLAALATTTVASTAALAFVGAPPLAFLGFTTVWVIALAVLSSLFDAEGADALQNGAYWLSIALGLGLVAATAPMWMPVVGLPQVAPHLPRTAQTFTDLFAGSPAWAVSLALFGVAGAFAFVSGWRWRHPTIALTVPGLVASLALLNLATYAAPLVLVPAVGTLAAAGFGLPGSTWALFALFALGLGFAKRAEDLYPTGALDVAASGALLLAGYQAVANPTLAAVLLAGGAAVFLWRSVMGRSLWAHVAFLVLATASSVTLGSRVPRMLALAGASVVLVGLARPIASRTASAWPLLMLFWASLLAAVAVALASVTGQWTLIVCAVVWSGFLVLPHREGDDPTRAGAVARRVAYSVGHAAGALLVVFVARAAPLPDGAEAAALAAWAWLHQALLVSRLGNTRDRSLAEATQWSVHVFAAASLGLAVAVAGPVTWVACALTYAVLCFLIAGARAGGARSLVQAGYGLALLAVGLGVAAGWDAAFVALLGAAGIFLWRSMRDASAVPHIVFLLLGTTAAAILGVQTWPFQGLLALALFAVIVAFAARAVRAREGTGAKVEFTLAWAMALGGAALLVEVALRIAFLPTFAAVWLGFLAGFWRVERREGTERREGAREQPDRRRPRFSDDAFIPLGGLGLAHAAGALLLWFLLGAAGIAAHRRGVFLVAWAALHFLAYKTLAARWPALPGTLVTRHAVHVLAGAAVVTAVRSWAHPVWPVATCGAVALLYGLWLSQERRPILQHAAAAALILAAALQGVALQVRWPDYYLSLVGLYLCVLLLQARSTAPAPRERGRKPALDRRDFIALLAILFLAAYPFGAVLWGDDAVHLAFLSGAAVLLLYLLPWAGAQDALVYGVCALSLGAIAYALTLGEPQRGMWPLLVLAGSLVVASPVLILGPGARLFSHRGRK